MIEAEATKQRDMPRGTVFRYWLAERILGKDQDGDDISTCVVERAADGEETRRARVKGKAEIALQALHTAIEQHGVQRTGPDYLDGRSVTQEQWKECAGTHHLFEGLTEASEKATFNRAIRELNDKGLARGFNGIWWLA